MQREKWLFYPLLFVFFFTSSLQAISFKDIVFEPAKAAFVVQEEEEVQESSSNQVKIKVEVNEDKNQTTTPTQPILSFYRYDANADDYLTVSKTDFSPNEDVSGSFNPMTPLLLEDDQEIDISKKIPAIRCLVFRRDEPLIVVYHDNNASKKRHIKLIISTQKDKEIIRLSHSDENSSIFVGYINTTTKCLRKCDGKLFVEKGTQIEASLREQTAKHSRSKSRSVRTRVFALASVESEALQTTASQEKREADIWVGLKASKDVASMGEFIKYTCVIENRGDKDVLHANISNKLFAGLAYRKDTFMFEEERVLHPLISKENQEMTFGFAIKAREEKHFSFVARVGINAKKIAKSRAVVSYHDKQSNISYASTKIEKDFDDKSLIVGRVLVDKADKNISLSGVRFYMENGTFVHSDKAGKFHFEDVEPGSHVVSIDPVSISGRFVQKECKANARNMASKTSYFVDTSASHIQEISFCLEEDNQTKALKSRFSFSIDKEEDEMPAFGEKDFAKESNSFLWPREGFVPPMPSVKVAFLHKSDEKMVLFLNGKKVDLLNYDGFVKSTDKKSVISKYRGVDIVDGDNILEAKIQADDGKVLKTIRRKIHLSTSPVKAKVLEEKSSLIADGKNSPVIAVQLFDMAGYPLRAGMVGTFSLEKPYLSQERLDALTENPLGDINGKNRYTVTANGIVFIPLQATTTSGEVKIHFPFQNSNEYTKVWLNSVAREWFIVGFAEGTVGYNALKTELMATSEKSVITDKKISLFAKGTVGADTLLSIAYDSGKKDDLGILETIDPKSEYTVYADESLQQNEAPSSKKLYIKIEKKSFYALFGDFDTGLDTHELSRYSRRINGIKSELKAEVFEYNAFISQSSTSFLRQEIQGDGTSGLYHLDSKAIMIGSEKVTIEVRDRYRDEKILSKRVLSPLLDYNIDYTAGTLYFKEPILSRDREGNPQFIIVEGESENGGKKRLTYGGRGAMKLFSGKLELGLTTLGEENRDDDFDTLYGFDARVNAGNNLIFNAEYASSQKSLENNSTSAKAYLVELSRHDSHSETKLYYKMQEELFGFGQQNLSQGGTRKYGVDSLINYWENIAIKLALYGDEVLRTGKTKNVAEAFLQYQKDDLLGSVGYRYGKSSDESSANSQLVSTISKRFFHNKVKLSAAYDYTLGGKSDTLLNRSFAEASYFINKYVEIFANHEIQEGASIKMKQSRAGIKGRPWSGATLESAVSNKFENDTARVFGLMGLNQNWQVTKAFLVNAAIEREQTMSGEGEDFTAYSFGLNYRKNAWVYSAKTEYRTSKEEDKINLDLGLYTEVNEDLGLALGVRSHIVNGENKSQNTDAKFSLAYRPEGDFLVLNRLEYIDERDEDTKVAKAIERFLCVVHPSQKSTLSGHYGLKYVQDTIDDEVYDSWIDTAGVEYLYDVTKRIELGLQGSLLHSYESQSLLESLGVYVGYNLFKNTYIGLGYNFEGYHDSDFSAMSRSERGVYMKFRLKFDQESLRNTLNLF